MCAIPYVIERPFGNVQLIRRESVGSGVVGPRSTNKVP